MFAYVNEDKEDHSNARLENLKALRLCVFKYLGVNLLLCKLGSLRYNEGSADPFGPSQMPFRRPRSGLPSDRSRSRSSSTLVSSL